MELEKQKFNRYPWSQARHSKPCCEPRTIIETDQLQLSYGKQKVFSHVSLKINQGCITGIVGPSGCGKSSFLMSLNRLTDQIENAAVRGRVEFHGADIYSFNQDVTFLRKKIGFVFQKPNPFPISIEKNLDIVLKDHTSLKSQRRKEKIKEVLIKVGLWEEVKDRLHSMATKLSGGQQQRLCIARALLLDPEILLLDEPCSALDPLASEIIEDLIDSLRGKYTIVMVTHQLAQARRICDDIAVFWVENQIGRLIEFGRAVEIFESPKHELTQSYIRGLRG